MNLAAGDGIYSVETNGDILLVDLKTGTNRTLAAHTDIKNVIYPSQFYCLVL